ncbi:serine/threonine-protein kinase [Streptomyces sp. NPDC051940]|uniref:serine/threonine-protein kinase n=1 Tax=Streptomyces sp. NPDC051940 TaxID=3155675 RepID=UPI00341384D0
MLDVELHRDFRYIHEPLPVGDAAIPPLGHADLVKRLRERLRFSHGGTFLVTGFRGVGKSTLVLRALAQAAEEWRGDNEELVIVHLSVARSMTPDQLLFAVVRRIFETLGDHGLLQRLPREVREPLLLAYTRTSLSYKEMHSDTREAGGAAGFGAQQGPLAAVAPNLNIAGKRIRAQAMEASFLAYSETDVEHDLMRIIRLLSGLEGPDSRPRRLLRRRRDRRLRVHPVIVLDEIDKLTDNREEALREFEELLGRLKNVLTTRGAHFLVVAGPDLHDRAILDTDRGNGVYESVFAWRMYVPCLWNAPEALVRGLTGMSQVDVGSLLEFIAYLRFKSRGVPRRLLQEFNGLIQWNGPAPSLRVPAEEWARIGFYGGLEALVDDAVTAHVPAGLLPVPIDQDRWRLGGYHVVDWALRSKGRPFTCSDIVGSGTDDAQSIDPLLRMDSPTAERLLRHLNRGGVLDVVSEAGRPDATLYGDQAAVQVTYYKLADDIRRRLDGFTLRSEAERADLGLEGPRPPDLFSTTFVGTAPPARGAAPAGVQPPGAAADGRRESVITLMADRYEVLAQIGQGGMGAVYRGRDSLTGQAVAVKLLHRQLLADEVFRTRLRREASVVRQLNHPNVVRFVDLVDDPEPALVMELVDGPSLASVLRDSGPLEPVRVAVVARQLGAVLEQAAGLGLSRFDLKPSNVLMHPVRGAVMIDLGIAHFDNADARLTRTGVALGTPGYMAPEQVRGEPTDIRADLFALGLLLYECLVGRPAFEGDDLWSRLYRIVQEDLPVSDLPVTPQLRDVLARLTARQRESRFPSPEDFLRALEHTPEAVADVDLRMPRPAPPPPEQENAEVPPTGPTVLLPAQRPGSGRQSAEEADPGTRRLIVRRPPEPAAPEPEAQPPAPEPLPAAPEPPAPEP